MVHHRILGLLSKSDVGLIVGDLVFNFLDPVLAGFLAVDIAMGSVSPVVFRFC
jgi:hypothetical protein